MKQAIAFLALGVGLLSGCSEQLSEATAAGLGGTYDLTLTGRYLFVTSSDRNELRVLDLEASPRSYVRAPNPLEPLSIPVLPRPTNLTRDVRYKVEGGQVEEDSSGPYVYARSFGSQEISVVASDPAYFKQLKRLQDLGFVTAFAARGPEGSRSTSVLYYAVQNGRDAALYRMYLPGPETLTQDTVVTPELLTAVSFPGETVTSLLVLPAPLGQEGLDPQPLVIATRSTTGVGGRTFRLELNTPGATPVDYVFGAPVRLLATHPRAEVGKDAWNQCSFDPTTDPAGNPLPQEGEKILPPPPLTAGQYVFGVLDESFCGGQAGCSGVLAVDASTGVRATDATGLPMLPISVGGALPTGLTLAAGVELLIDCSNNVATRQLRPLVGIVPSSNGVITLFDAVRMRQFDLDAATVGAAYVLVDNTGAEKDFTAAELATHLTVQVLEGVTPDDTYRLLYQGLLPNLASLERSNVACGAGVTCFEVDTAAAGIAEVEDVIVLQDDAGECPVDLVVTEKRPGTRVQLVTATPIPAECAGMPRFSVRAANAARPFVAYSDRLGFLGRLGEGNNLSVPGRYFFHPTRALQPDPKELVLGVNFIARGLTRGDQYIVTTLSHFLPYIFGVDTESIGGGLAAYRLPGSAVYTRVGDQDYTYIAYPSADGILQVTMEAITDNAANITGLNNFE